MPSTPLVLAGVQARPVQAPPHRPIQRLDDQGRLAAARHPGDAGEGGEREFDIDSVEVVGAGPDHRQGAARRAAARPATAPRRHRDLPEPGEVLAGEAFRAGHDVARGAAGDDVPAVDAGAGAHVDDVIGAADGVLVVLNDNYRVVEVAQALEGGEQPVVVALVEPDGGLVEHVEHPRQTRSYLRGEADALALTARERRRGA